MMVLSPLTGTPVAIVPVLTITDDLLYLTPTEVEGNVEGYERPTRNAGGSGPDVGRPDDTTDGTRTTGVPSAIVTPGTPLTASHRRVVRSIPLNTPIMV